MDRRRKHLPKQLRYVKFRVPPDEGGAGSGNSDNPTGGAGGTGPGAGNGNPNTPAILPDETQVALEDGSVVTIAELRNGYLRQSDATVKWQEASELRRQAEARQAEVDQKATQVEKESVAMNADLVWYANHPQSEWDSYVPEIAKVRGLVKPGGSNVNGTVTPPVGASAIPADVVQDIKDVKTMLKTDADARALEATKAAVRETTAHYRQLIAGEFKLADEESVLDKIELYQGKNGGKLPPKSEVTRMVKEVHEKYKARGAKEPIGVVPQSGSTRRDIVSDGASALPPSGLDKLDVNDTEAVSSAYTDYVKSLAAR